MGFWINETPAFLVFPTFWHKFRSCSCPGPPSVVGLFRRSQATRALKRKVSRIVAGIGAADERRGDGTTVIPTGAKPFTPSHLLPLAGAVVVGVYHPISAPECSRKISGERWAGYQTLETPNGTGLGYIMLPFELVTPNDLT